MTSPHPPAGSETFSDSFVVRYNPLPMANRVAQLSRVLWTSVVTTLIGLVVWTVVFIVERRHLGGRSLWLMAAGYVVSLVLLAVRVVRLVMARRHLGSVGSGTALEVSRTGIVGDTGGGHAVSIPWGTIAAVSARRGGAGRGPDLVVTRHDGTDWRVPLEFLDALPGTIDNAVRVYSSGRLGLDASRLDSLI